MRSKQYLEQAVYQIPFLIGSGHQLDLFSSVGHSVHLSKNKSALLSIPKSNSEIVILPVLCHNALFIISMIISQYFLWKIISFPCRSFALFVAVCHNFEWLCCFLRNCEIFCRARRFLNRCNAEKTRNGGEFARFFLPCAVL